MRAFSNILLNCRFFFRTGRIRKRRKQSLVGETDVVAGLERCFPILAEAFSESDCGVFRMQAFCNIELSFFRTGRIRKRRKKLLVNKTDVVVRFQGRFPNLAEGVFRMWLRCFPSVAGVFSEFVRGVVKSHRAFCECGSGVFELVC